MSDNIYLDIRLSDFEKKKKVGIEECKANGDEDGMSWPNLTFNIDSAEFRDGKLYNSGRILDVDLTDFGYLSVDVQLNLDIVIDIIEYYMKKLGKLKTVLEATK